MLSLGTPTDAMTDETSDTTQLRSLLPATDAPLRATVFVRSLAPISRKQTQDQLMTRLDVLTETGALSEVDLLVWGDSVCTTSPLTEVGCGQRVVDAIGEFYALAAETPFSVDPFFRISEVTSELTGESFRRITPPRQCLALYDGSELVAVFPSLVDGVDYTPRDALSVLEARREEAAPVPMADESA